MKKIIKLLFVFELFLIVNLFAQSGAGAMFLLISPSPTFNGMGEIGVCLPSDDPMASYYNPANGMEGFRGISLQGSYYEVPWLPNLVDDMSHSYAYLGMGITPASSKYKLVLSYSNNYLNLGEQLMTDEIGNELSSFHSYMSSDMMTLAVSTDWNVLKIASGISIKHAFQYLSPLIGNFNGSAGIILFDAGILVSTKIKANLFNDLKLIVSPAIGYSMLNIGGPISFSDITQADPSPRTARAGISITSGVYDNKGHVLIELKGGLSASDLLVNSRISSDDPISYQRGLGDIDIFKHILQSKDDESPVQVERGYELTLVDILSFRTGVRIDNQGRINLDESGWGIDFTKLLQLVSLAYSYPQMEKFSRHFSLRYDISYWTDYPGHPLNNTNYSSLVFGLNNISTLFEKDDKYLNTKNTVPVNYKIIFGAGYNMSLGKRNDSYESVSDKGGMVYNVNIENRIGRSILGFGMSTFLQNYEFTSSGPVPFMDSDGSLVNNSVEKKVVYNNYGSIYFLKQFRYNKRISPIIGAKAIIPININDKSGEESNRPYYENDDKFNVAAILGLQYSINDRIGFRLNYDIFLRPYENSLYKKNRNWINSLSLNLVLGI